MSTAQDKPLNILFAAKQERWAQYEQPLKTAFDAFGLIAHLATDIAPEEVDYIVYAPNSPVQDFSVFPELKAVLNLWAGVEDVVGNRTLTAPLCRMVDPSLTDGMVEWVTGHVLRHHLGMDSHILGQDGVWRAGIVPPLAQDRKVVVLGLGELGLACARSLAALKFDVHGWSRSKKEIQGVTHHTEVDNALAVAEIIVLLLPLTPETTNLLDARRLGVLPEGAVIINPGRGPLIDDDALLAALATGHVAHATLDVFRQEPLPKGHPFWAHPNVTVTPHIASETRAVSASRVIAENIRRSENGLPLLHVVDRTAGY
ncbi:2-hydroxyacid dehydrogenase [Litoreibacter roseus]|uniref:Glyoxylate/hydroxypyruvate reductase A n=1 Tax=Litoreibacter roseus TaxID=2601869 RepID=A0A6N6JI36_9RHOB|nr:glyoxylate/hydroxypyruvate reductase A [Litoreibacter roseus]GFE65069.1 glyoxylate/hydroxypyruvate reductase A [Litoreibacter roseus]